MADELYRYDELTGWNRVTNLNRIESGGGGGVLYNPKYKYEIIVGDCTTNKNYFASSEFSINYTAAMAFDDNLNKYWSASGYVNQFVGVDLGEQRIVNKMTIMCNPSRMIAFKLQGSNNTSSWHDVYSGLRENNTDVQVFAFSNTVPYRYYRVLNTGNLFTGSNLTISEIELICEEESYISSETESFGYLLNGRKLIARHAGFLISEDESSVTRSDGVATRLLESAITSSSELICRLGNGTTPVSFDDFYLSSEFDRDTLERGEYGSVISSEIGLYKTTTQRILHNKSGSELEIKESGMTVFDHAEDFIIIKDTFSPIFLKNGNSILWKYITSMQFLN